MMNLLNNPLSGKFERFWNYNELLKQLVIRDIKLKYRRSYLGYFWSILNPLMMMGVITFIFSNLFSRFDIPNYPLYLISGQVIFSFMNEATNMAVSSIIGNAHLLKKTYVPKYIFTFSKVISSLVNMLFSLGALLLVIIFTQAPISIHLFFFPIIVLQVFIFCLGISLLLSSLNVFFRDVQYLWSVIITMWLYLTPIFYPVEIIPEEFRTLYKSVNPMYMYIEQFRDILLHAKFPEQNLILIGLAAALCSLLIGTYFFNRKQNEFILYI